MKKELKYFFYVTIILGFLIFVVNYYFSDQNKKETKFKENLNQTITFIHSKFNNVMYVNPESQINEKNFKVKIGNNDFIKEIGVNIFDENAKIAYPLYKLSKSSMKIWMKEIDNYIQQDKTNLYGEDAFNNISDKINLMPMYTTDFCMEIDDHEDLLEAKKYYEKNGLK